jgi:hypothetical protein
MRRLLTFAAFLLIISVVPVCAQHGGGHGSSGGSHGGFSGGHSSFSGSHGRFVGHSGFVGHGSVVGGSHVASHFGSHVGSGQRSFVRGDHSRNGRVGFRNRYGYGYGYPYYGYPLYAYGGIDPYWWWDTYSSNDQDDAQQREEAAEMNAQNLEQQQALREQDQDAYARPMSRPHASPARAAEQAENSPATVLVFRDQHQREIQNYAIVDEMLWIFTPQRIEKVPLAVLNVPATIKANDDRGVGFRLPEASTGQ